jgi:hypothetical protein
MIVVTRLLMPAQFGLVAMVTVVTGIYGPTREASVSETALHQATFPWNNGPTRFDQYADRRMSHADLSLILTRRRHSQLMMPRTQ